VLRQQLNIVIRKLPKRLPLTNSDRLLLVWLYRLFPSILSAIRIVRPETVIRWHRRGFQAYWHRKSRHGVGRPPIDGEIRDLIRQMSMANPLWGAPRVHGELLMLGIEVAQSTVADGLGLDDHQALTPLRPPARQQDPKQPIQTTEARATSSAALQHRNLMAQRDRFQHQRGAGSGFASGDRNRYERDQRDFCPVQGRYRTGYVAGVIAV
jgi:hypothetical protein